MSRQRVELSPENAAIVNELVTLGFFKTPTIAANYLLSVIGKRALHRLRRKLKHRLLERDDQQRYVE
ncbi:MAG: hypothetical protein H7Z11_11505 [Verrucomicrobia bacterium]|nr:hypothetical protein [Leptolyngbya sp. ES-bin-22]